MKLNELPVKTYRWLDVNDYTLEDIPKYKAFNGKLEKIGDAFVDYLDDFYFNASDLMNYVDDNMNSKLFIKSQKGKKEKMIIKYTLDEYNDVLIDKTLLIAEEGSTLNVILEYKGEGKHLGYIKIHAKPYSKVNVYLVQALRDHSLNVFEGIGVIEDNAEIEFIQVEIGAKKSITNYFSDILGYSGSSRIHSAYFVDKDRYVDISYRTNLIGQKAQSNMIVKGALKDKAKKIFKGTLDFKKGCKMAKGNEEEYAIILDKEIKSDSVPLLLCSEDDVEGSHAASTGKIDENKLFYLMSRGFSEREAKLLLIEASLKPIIDLIPDEEIKAGAWKFIEGRMSNV